MKVIKAVDPFAKELSENFSIFLAGSIEMGKAENWQEKVERILEDEDGLILNPHRDDWDSSWDQTPGDNQFTRQVLWELVAQDKCDMIIMYFDPDTKSPITLLELGLFGGMYPNKLVVCCPDGFYRKGNVQITCDWKRIKQVDSVEELVDEVKLRLNR